MKISKSKMNQAKGQTSQFVAIKLSQTHPIDYSIKNVKIEKEPMESLSQSELLQNNLIGNEDSHYPIKSEVPDILHVAFTETIANSLDETEEDNPVTDGCKDIQAGDWESKIRMTPLKQEELDGKNYPDVRYDDSTSDRKVVQRSLSHQPNMNNEDSLLNGKDQLPVYRKASMCLKRRNSEIYKNSKRIQANSHLSPVIRLHCNNEHEIKSLHIHDNKDNEISPYDLAAVLATYPDFSASLLDLLKDRYFLPASVTLVADQFPQIFKFEEENVRLDPDIKICKAYSGSKGCQSRKLCSDLHICKKYALGECMKEDCVWGHNWDTGHNIPVLRNFNIYGLPSHALQKLFKDSKGMLLVNDTIKVCDLYNGEGCDSAQCTSLHICLPFLVGVMNGNFSPCSQNCSLNHDLLSSSCISVLENCGISSNETVRDIALEIFASNPALSDGKQSSCSDNDNRSPLSVACIQSVDDSASTPELTNSASDIRTVWSHYLEGDVPVAEICYFSVETVCNFESTGCNRLHAVSHFHWQVREQGGPWLNLRSNQVTYLERAYCDPSKNCVTLPRLDPSSLDLSSKGLFTIMGRDSWFTDFYTMTISSTTLSKLLHIRRLCTEKMEIVTIKPSKFVWYFFDASNEWVEYGKFDTLGNANLVANITSEQIETAYLQNPAGTVQFVNTQFVYELNFQLMLQVNQTTGTFRQVMRRPQPHLQDEGLEDLPETWNVMLPKQRVQRVCLTGTSPEYKAILEHLSRNPNLNYRWMSIERIQNPYLWRAYQNKVKEMTLLYGSRMAVDIRYLYHGTNHDIVQNICEENFDWRLHGAKNGQAFGRGTYFATDLQMACNYAKPDANGYRTIFVASVAIGSKTLGNPVMQRPPINPTTKLPFDSTVNNMQNPVIIVKYDKQEYYPEYLIVFC